MELDDAYISLNQSRKEISNIFKHLSKLLPFNLLSTFYEGQESRCQRLWRDKEKNMKEEIEWLVSKQSNKFKKINEIRPITYISSIQNKNILVLETTNEPLLNPVTDESIKYNITITPDNFGLQSHLDTVNEKWFVNLSGVIIPKEVQFLLQLGDRFNLPLMNKKTTAFEFIKCIEQNIIKCDEELKYSIRNDASHIINRMRTSQNNFDDNDKLLLS